MLAVVFLKAGEFTIKEIPEPVIGRDQVLVRVKSTTICGTDFKILHGHVPHVTFPHIPGHEWGGEIVEVGEDVMNIQPGDKVGVEAHVGCGICLRCAEGLYNLCENYGKPEMGHAHIGFTVPGGLATYCAIPARAAHILPKGLDFDHGAFTDTVGIVLWAFKRAGGVRGGESVAVIGPGALGLLAVQLARALGAGQIIAVGGSGDNKRLELASALGANVTINGQEVDDPVRMVHRLTFGRGADLVIEFAGTADAGRQSIEMARRGGRVVLGGATSPGHELTVDLSAIVRGHLDVCGTVANPRSISSYANTMMQNRMVNIQPLITHHLPLSEFNHAWELFGEKESGAIRILLHP